MAETKEEFTDAERIRIFKETYNATYLQTLSRDKIERLKITVNPILAKLLDNLFVRKTYMSEMIEGPKCFYKVKLGKKSFYIFGEDNKTIPTGHCLPDDSLPFQEYIKRLSRETPSFFDLYLELPMVRSIKPDSEEKKEHYNLTKGNPFPALKETIKSMIENPTVDFNVFFSRYKKMFDINSVESYTIKNTIDLFLDCLQPSTRKTSYKCQLLRIHNIDARFSWLTEKIYDDFYTHISYFILNDSWKFNYDNQTKIKLIKNINKAVEVISSLYDFDNETINIEKLDRVIFSNRYVQKELDKVETNMKEKIINHYKQKIYTNLNPETVLNLKELILCLNDRILVSELSSYFTPVASFFHIMNASIMDMYCLSRIFKQYNVQDTFQPVESKNIIIYTDFFNSKSYKDFLQSIGGEVTHYSENYENKGCVKMTSRSQMAKLKIEETRDYFDELQTKAIAKNRHKIIDDMTNIDLGILITYEAQPKLRDIEYNTVLSDNAVIINVENLKNRIDSIYFSTLREKEIKDLDVEEEEDYDDIRSFYSPTPEPQVQPKKKRFFGWL